MAELLANDVPASAVQRLWLRVTEVRVGCVSHLVGYPCVSGSTVDIPCTCRCPCLWYLWELSCRNQPGASPASSRGLSVQPPLWGAARPSGSYIAPSAAPSRLSSQVELPWLSRHTGCSLHL